jgi:hypothetical protein
MSNISKDTRIQSFQIFEALKLMWPKAHRCSVERGSICTLLKFDIQAFYYAL